MCATLRDKNLVATKKRMKEGLQWDTPADKAAPSPAPASNDAQSEDEEDSPLALAVDFTPRKLGTPSRETGYVVLGNSVLLSIRSASWLLLQPGPSPVTQSRSATGGAPFFSDPLTFVTNARGLKSLSILYPRPCTVESLFSASGVNQLQALESQARSTVENSVSHYVTGESTKLLYFHGAS